MGNTLTGPDELIDLGRTSFDRQRKPLATNREGHGLMAKETADDRRRTHLFARRRPTGRLTWPI
jgi:hypothetical protein